MTSFALKENHAPDLLPEWIIEPHYVAYPKAVEIMRKRVDEIIAGRTRELIWLIEHPPLYTGGISAHMDDDLLDHARFPVFQSERGGQMTYHGPGQRVIYVMLDLNRRTKDVRAFVAALEAFIITALSHFNVEGLVREGRVGVWVERRDLSPPPYGEQKIAALGIKLKKWVSFHGLSLNVEPDLSHFSGIIPCGIREHGVTSLVDLGLPVTMDEVDYALKLAFCDIFGPVLDAKPLDANMGGLS